jgi:hypothetical protein
VLFVGLAAGTYSSIFLATPIVADLKEREPEQVALRRRVLARRSAAARQGTRAAAGPVASARRARGAARGGVALAERDAGSLGPARADVVVESPATVGPDAGHPHGATAAPRPGVRPQRPGGGKRRR